MSIALLMLFTLLTDIAEAKSLLYPRESVMQFADAQTLTYFKKADPEKPLVIFIPGDTHLARIAYGYPQGKEKDFLAYWVNERGYSFLGLSYPLDNPVYSKKYPDFTIHQWGEQIIQTAEYFIKQHRLSKKIIVLGWSMGGSVEQSVYAAAQKHGLEMEAFIGLAAVAPLPFIMQSGPFDTSIMAEHKLAKRDKLFPWFKDQLTIQNKLNGHKIIPKRLYHDEFLGNIPAALAAEGYFLNDGKFIKNNEMTYQDSGVFDFANTPWIALVVDDAKDDAKISLIEPYTWNFIRAEMVYQRYLKSGIAQEKWSAMQDLVKKMPSQLTTTVHGTHFFFVGELGAKNTALQIEILTNRIKLLKRQLKNHRVKSASTATSETASPFG